MVSTDYTVKLDAFEGPLDLLLHLVRSNEVDIYHLPIAEITDQYLSYLSMFEELNLNVAGEYLVMAASLMYMKSRLLLPADEEEEGEEEDGVEDLVRQLAEYEIYRDSAQQLRDRALLDRDVFRRPPSPPQDVGSHHKELRPVELADLFEALRKVLARAAARMPHDVGGEDYSVADAVHSLVAKLRQQGRVEFSTLFKTESPRGFIVATFLGLLELLKLGSLQAEQREIGGPIMVRLIDPDIESTVESLTETYCVGAAARADAVAVGGDSDE